VVAVARGRHDVRPAQCVPRVTLDVSLLEKIGEPDTAVPSGRRLTPALREAAKILDRKRQLAAHLTGDLQARRHE